MIPQGIENPLKSFNASQVQKQVGVDMGCTQPNFIRRLAYTCLVFLNPSNDVYLFYGDFA